MRFAASARPSPPQEVRYQHDVLRLSRCKSGVNSAPRTSTNPRAERRPAQPKSPVRAALASSESASARQQSADPIRIGVLSDEPERGISPELRSVNEVELSPRQRSHHGPLAALPAVAQWGRRAEKSAFFARKSSSPRTSTNRMSFAALKKSSGAFAR
jgi:hypothetical protein